MVAASPEGGWNGAALTGFAAAARAAREANEGPPLPAKNEPSTCSICGTKDSRIKSLETLIDRQSAVNDDQAATIVDLRAKLSAVVPGSSGVESQRAETIARLQAAEDRYRAENERMERRIIQLTDALREARVHIPSEHVKRWDRLDGTGLDPTTSKF